MGMDIYSGRGVIFTVDEFLRIVNGKNKSNVVSVCHTFHKELVDEANADTDSEWRNQLADRFKPFSTLKTSMKLSDIREIIASSIEVEGRKSSMPAQKQMTCHTSKKLLLGDQVATTVGKCQRVLLA
jgi:hypothetical protein